MSSVCSFLSAFVLGYAFHLWRYHSWCDHQSSCHSQPYDNRSSDRVSARKGNVTVFSCSVSASACKRTTLKWRSMQVTLAFSWPHWDFWLWIHLFFIRRVNSLLRTRKTLSDVLSRIRLRCILTSKLKKLFLQRNLRLRRYYPPTVVRSSLCSPFSHDSCVDVGKGNCVQFLT